MTVKELFDFITDLTITDDTIDEYLDNAMSTASSRTVDDVTQQQRVDEEVRCKISLFCYCVCMYLVF